MSTKAKKTELASSSAPGTERTLAMLELLGQYPKGLNLTEIARALKLPMNTVFRSANVLLEWGYLERIAEGKRFVLTNKLFELAQPRVREKSLSVCALPAMRQLRDATGETVQLTVIISHKATMIEQCLSTQPLKVSSSMGLCVPMYSCAPGKAALSCYSDLELNHYLGSVKLKQFTPNTLASRDKLLPELALARRVGYAVDRAEGLEGIHCVAAPVLDEQRTLVAAVTIIAPAFRLPEARFVSLGEVCKQAARSIEHALGA